MKSIAILAMIVLLCGCASIKIIPPKEQEENSSRIYDKPFEETWIKAVDWFAEHNVIIDKIEKSSGLLTARHKLKASDSLLDGGEIKATDLLRPAKIDKYGMLNVTVREKENNKSKVTVNFFGEFTLEGNDVWDASLVTAKGTCVSTGEVEGSILTYIAEE